VEALLEALYGSTLAEWMRHSRWGYASVNAVHILGFSLLVGAIATLDLRLLGAWRTTPLEPLSRVLVPVAVTGLAVAAIAGALLFITRAVEYAAVTLFLVKMSLVAAGVVHALSVHAGTGLGGIGPSRRRLSGAVSLSIWLSVLVCGRMLAFVTD
jgi:hypothetical protein